MLTVPINQDITEYKPKYLTGLTIRTIACLGGALASSVAVALFLVTVLGVPSDAAMSLFWVPAIPCALIGFVTPHGMPFERWLPLWWRHKTARHRICYASSDALARQERDIAKAKRKEGIYERKAARSYARLAKCRGYELWSPGGEL